MLNPTIAKIVQHTVLCNIITKKVADDPVFRIPSPLLDLHSASANDIYRSTLEIRIYDAI